MHLDEQGLKGAKEALISSRTLSDFELLVVQKLGELYIAECWGLYDGFSKWRPYSLAGVISDTMKKRIQEQRKEQYDAAYCIGERIREELDNEHGADKSSKAA